MERAFDQVAVDVLRESASRIIDKALSSFLDNIFTRLEAIAVFPRVRPGSILRCPSEVFTLIFHCVFVGLEPVTSSFRIQRAKLSLVCKFWNQVIVGDPSLWQNMFLTPEVEGDLVNRLLTISAQYPLSVYLVDLDYSARYGLIERTTAFLSVFHRVFVSSHRWVNLEVVTASPYAHKAMLDHVDDASCPALRSLTIRSPSHSQTLAATPMAITVYSSGLYRLVLHRCNFPEAFPALLPNLRVLSVSDLPTVHSPTQDHLFAFLRTAPCLDRLELVRVGIRVYPDVPAPAVQQLHLPSVTTLILAFNVAVHPARAFFQILRYLETPNLQHLHLGLPTDSDLKHYLGSHSMLRAPSVSLAGRIFDSLMIHLLFATFSGVVVLDVVDADRPAVVWQIGSIFAAGQHPSMVVLPSLRVLRLRPHKRLESLRDVLKIRSEKAVAVARLEMVPHLGVQVDGPADRSHAFALLLPFVGDLVWGERRVYETHEILRYAGEEPH
ncbi:hypothetical protein R3P38DRAFT_3239933 [Favolaschia claudopus]|uniref:F-box domain-containing protein n=1 Tax=Favolaschia claudopus TaxID=2862362 RepID=A0AAV9Z7K0_9AGAR